jgi:putative nucleotidyltransferase with HDIG domain
VKAAFGKDEGLLAHTLEVEGHAARMHESEGGDPLVVHVAALLHDIGIPRAREVHGSSAGKFQEIEGPPLAEKILAELGVQEEAIDLIRGIVANHHSASDEDIAGTVEFRIVWDADWLVNFPGQHRNASKEEVSRKIEEVFRTAKGRETARALFVAGDSR